MLQNEVRTFRPTVFLKNLETGFPYLLWPLDLASALSTSYTVVDGAFRRVNCEFHHASGYTTSRVAYLQNGEICIHSSSAKPPSGNAGFALKLIKNPRSLGLSKEPQGCLDV